MDKTSLISFHPSENLPLYQGRFLGLIIIFIILQQGLFKFCPPSMLSGLLLSTPPGPLAIIVIPPLVFWLCNENASEAKNFAQNLNKHLLYNQYQPEIRPYDKISTTKRQPQLEFPFISNQMSRIEHIEAKLSQFHNFGGISSDSRPMRMLSFQCNVK